MISNPKPLLRLAAVLDLTKISRSALYSAISAKTFPAQIKHNKSSFWVAEEVSSWIDQRIAERDQLKKEGGAK